jgi:hypothetical protein
VEVEMLQDYNEKRIRALEARLEEVILEGVRLLNELKNRDKIIWLLIHSVNRMIVIDDKDVMDFDEKRAYVEKHVSTSTRQTFYRSRLRKENG